MLSDNIKMLRESLGFSAKEFSKMCNLPRTTYRQIESGAVKNPCLKQLCLICRAGGVTPNDLIPERYYKMGDKDKYDTRQNTFK